MKLSEAIRLGAMLRPQGHGGLRKSQGGVLATCALGAACDAVGIAIDASGSNMEAYAALRARWPILREPVMHPEDGNMERMLEITYLLNDISKWSRERIADWVETVEPVCDAMMVDREREEELCHVLAVSL